MWEINKQEEGTIPQCSFCGKSQEQVERLIAGPGRTYICNECVDLYREHLDKMARERQPITMEKLSQTCASCGIRVPGSHHYCYNCGNRFTGERS